MRRWLTLAVALLGAAVPGAAFAPVPAVAAPATDNCLAPPTDPGSAWAQQLLGADRAWPLSRGDGERIALLGTGVDAHQPRLAGQVEAGFDAAANKGTGDSDCVGTGTQIAGTIVAQAGNDGVAGVAPGARVVPVRVVPAQDLNGTVDPAALARGINWAVDQEIRVICVTAAVVDTPQLAQAVQRAVSAGAVVVAAAGDRGGNDDTNPTPYPAAYPGVLGVGAIDISGARWPKSVHGSFVNVAAPGAGGLSTWRGRGTAAISGTGAAAGFVAATVALVWHRWKTYHPQQVVDQILASATPAAGAVGGPDFGAGVVSPVGAVSQVPATGRAQAPPALSPSPGSQADRDRAAAWRASRTVATVLALAGGGLVVLVLVIAVASPRGRRRSWRPVLAAPPVDPPEQEEPSPPVMLFSDN